MSRRRADPAVRAGRWLRWYPAEWRARYGEEFRALLVAEMEDGPRWLRLGVDVAAGGIMARLADAGLTGTPVPSSRPAPRRLATFGCAVAVFLTVAVSMWSQLDIAGRLSGPTVPATHTAIAVMTAALFGCLALAAVGALPVAGEAALAVVRRTTPGLWRPALLSAAGTAVMVAGGLHFSRGWPGPGPQPVGAHGPVAFLWAATLAVSAYWAHPSILAALPAGEMAWMAVSPVALVASVAGAARTVRRVDLAPGTVRFVGHLSRAVSAGLGVFVLGTLIWLVDGGPGPGSLYRAGTVDLVGLAVMVGALGLAARSARAGFSPSPAPSR